MAGNGGSDGNQWSDAEWQAWVEGWSEAEWQEWNGKGGEAASSAAASSSSAAPASKGKGEGKGKKGKGKRWSTPGAPSRKRRDEARMTQEVKILLRSQRGMPVSSAPLQEQIRWERKLRAAERIRQEAVDSVNAEAMLLQASQATAGVPLLPSYIPPSAGYFQPVRPPNQPCEMPSMEEVRAAHQNALQSWQQQQQQQNQHQQPNQHQQVIAPADFVQGTFQGSSLAGASSQQILGAKGNAKGHKSASGLFARRVPQCPGANTLPTPSNPPMSLGPVPITPPGDPPIPQQHVSGRFSFESLRIHSCALH